MEKRRADGLSLYGRSGNQVLQLPKFVFSRLTLEEENIHWIRDSLSQCLSGLVPGLSVNVHLFITGKHAEGLSPVDSIGEKIKFSGSYSDVSSVPGVSVEMGRPDLQALLGKEIQDASGPVSVNGAPSAVSWFNNFSLLFFTSVWWPVFSRSGNESCSLPKAYGYFERWPHRIILC